MVYSTYYFAIGTEFCECVQVGIGLCIPHLNNQMQSHSSPGLSAACAATIARRSHVISFVSTE